MYVALLDAIGVADCTVIGMSASGPIALLAARDHAKRFEGLDARVQVATLIMHGSEDDLVPVEHARYHAEQNPAAELEIVEGAGHGFMHSFRNETVTRSRAFLQQTA